MISRLISEAFIPAWPMAMPSVTVIVGELARGAACGGDAFLSGLGLAGEGNVAGCCLVPSRRDPDQRLIDLCFAEPHRIEKGAMRSPLRTDGDMPARQPRFVYGRVAEVVRHGNAPVGGDRGGTVPPPPGAINAARRGDYPQRGCSPRSTPSAVLPTISCTRKVFAG